jgi:succinate dehydrogenase/fumarate reductase cytochrome b subunit
MFGKIVIVAAFAVVVYNLGAGLYYMMVDKSGSDRVVKALTRRIALSVGLIALVALGIWMGWIEPHGIGG